MIFFSSGKIKSINERISNVIARKNNPVSLSLFIRYSVIIVTININAAIRRRNKYFILQFYFEFVSCDGKV